MLENKLKRHYLEYMYLWCGALRLVAKCECAGALAMWHSTRHAFPEPLVGFRDPDCANSGYDCQLALAKILVGQ